MSSAVREASLVLAKNILFHALCARNPQRYLALKARLMLAAASAGLYERQYMRLLPTLVRPGADVADVGANAGTYTRALARAVGAEGRVFAFEPNPDVAASLARRASTWGNVHVERVLLSDGLHASAELRVPQLAGGVPEPALGAAGRAPDGRPRRVWRTYQVRAARLDDYLDTWRALEFVKADVEGDEAAFLEGAMRTLERFMPVVQLEAAGTRQLKPTPRAWAESRGYVLCSVSGTTLVPFVGERDVPLNVYLVPTRDARLAVGRMAPQRG